ncbi:hypothetical protein [Pseudopelagicola sp. nBUS_19]
MIGRYETNLPFTSQFPLTPPRPAIPITPAGHFSLLNVTAPRDVLAQAV